MSSATYQAMFAENSQKINLKNPLSNPNGTRTPKKAPKGYEVADQRVVQIYPLEEDNATPSSENNKQNASLDVDIVFVPGLGADPIESWSSNDSSFNWMKDKTGLQSKYPRARLLLFKYESAYLGGFKVRQYIENLADTLLVELKAKRETCRARPIVFIGHSMGGLIIAKAIVLASSDVGTSRQIFNTTTGCIFFGTPFRGASIFSSISSYARSAEKENKGAVHSTLLDLLEPENGELRQLRIEFTRLASRNNQTISCHCFWEQDQSDISKLRSLIAELKGVDPQIFNLPDGNYITFVRQESATLENCKNTGLHSDHRGLVKIDSCKEGGAWTQINEHLREIVDNAQSAVKSRLNAVRNIDLSVLSAVMKALEGGQIERKEEALLKSVATSSWLPSEDEYNSWLGGEKPVDCLFVQGREGRGKTSAALAALEGIRKEQDAKRNLGGDYMLAYFFCDIESDYSTAEDVLKSLVRQLLIQKETLAPHAVKFTRAQKRKDERTKQVEAKASVENLWQSLQGMLSDELIGNKVYFVLNNLHILPPESESTKKLMNYIKSELSTEQPQHHTKTRWFITSRNLDGIINGSENGDCVQIIDLEDSKHKSKVQNELERHAKKMVTALGEKKHYNRALSYFASSLIGRRAQNTQWIDILCIQLEELSTSSDLTVRDILESTPQDLKSLLNQAWQQIFQLNRDKAGEIRELLRTMVLTYEDPTEMELAVLAGFSSTDEERGQLHKLIEQCKPLLSIRLDDENNPTISFINLVVKTHLFDNANTLLGLTEEGIKWQQGVLTHRCLSYLKTLFNYPEQEPTPDPLVVEAVKAVEPVETVEADKDTESVEADKNTEEEPSISPEEKQVLEKIKEDKASAYAVKHWLHHASKATLDIAEELSLDEEFWKPSSLIRRRWLAGYCGLTDVLTGFQYQHLNSLHVAASIGFSRLVGALIRNGYKDEITKRDQMFNTPLHFAAYFGRLNTVEELLTSGAPVDDCADIHQATPLSMAAAGGQVSVMQKLLARDADPNSADENVGPVISAAIVSGNISAVELLVEYDKQKVVFAKYKVGDEDGDGENANEENETPSPLALAAMLADEQMFNFLMKKFEGEIPLMDYLEALATAAAAGRDVVFKTLLDNAPESDEIEEIYQAIFDLVEEYPNWEIFRVLLERCEGMHVNVSKLFFAAATCNQKQDDMVEHAWKYSGESMSQEILDNALYQATDGEKETTVKLLLGYGANPNAPGEKYGNALTASAFDGTINILRHLLEANADPNSPEGWALQIAAGQGHKEIVEELLQHGANVNALTENPNFPQGSAMQAACESSKLEIVQLLLEHGANPNNGSGIDSPPIIAAARRGQADILDVLVQAGADLNVFGGPDKSTPLINAAAFLPTTSLRTLLDAGADINLADEDGDTALIISAFRGDVEAVQFLLENDADIMHFNNNNLNALIAAYNNQQTECLEKLIIAYSAVLLSFRNLMVEHKVDISTLFQMASQVNGNNEKDRSVDDNANNGNFEGSGHFEGSRHLEGSGHFEASRHLEGSGHFEGGRHFEGHVDTEDYRDNDEDGYNDENGENEENEENGGNQDDEESEDDVENGDNDSQASGFY